MNDDLSLTSGGDCKSHWHSEDRVPTQVFLHGLQTVSRGRTVTGATTITSADDFLIADTRTASLILTLPIAKNGNEYEIIKPYSANLVTVLPSGTNTIMGNTGATISVGGAAIRLKSFDTDWKIV